MARRGRVDVFFGRLPLFPARFLLVRRVEARDFFERIVFAFALALAGFLEATLARFAFAADLRGLVRAGLFVAARFSGAGAGTSSAVTSINA